MPRVVLVLCLFFSVHGLGQDSQEIVQTNSESRSGEQNKNTDTQKKVSDPADVLNNTDKERKSSKNTYNPKCDYNCESLEIAKDDLVMQRTMAIGTAFMALFSLVALGISGVGICLLIKNLRKTQEIINLDRAWLVPDLENMAFTKGSFDRFDEAELFLEIPIRNTGKLPAQKVVFRFETVIFNAGFNDKRLEFNPKLPALSIGVIGPSFTNLLRIPFSINDVYRISDDFEDSAFIHIQITYDTITGKRAITEQSFVLRVKGSIDDVDITEDSDGVVRVVNKHGIREAIRSHTIGAIIEGFVLEIKRFIGTNKMT